MVPVMEITVESVERLHFSDGSPVRAASAVVRSPAGFLVVQDDATYAALVRPAAVEPVRLLPPVEGHVSFDEASGTKSLKPDLEAACLVPSPDGRSSVLLLGSGSSPARTRVALVPADDPHGDVAVADLAPLYARVARTLGIELDVLNLEGACVVGGSLRWFHRGLPAAGLAPGSVDVPLHALLATITGQAPPEAVPVHAPRQHRLGEVQGTGLGITDAVTTRHGAVLLTAAAEDSPNVRDDGPIVGSALVLMDGEEVLDVTELPLLRGRVSKVEGLTVLEEDEGGVRLLAVVDSDDHTAASEAVRLLVRYA